MKPRGNPLGPRGTPHAPMGPFGALKCQGDPPRVFFLPFILYSSTDTVDLSTSLLRKKYIKEERADEDFHILLRGMRGQGVQMAFGHHGDKSGLML